MNPTPCPTCGGHGLIQSPTGTLQICPTCDGSGEDPGVERFFVWRTAVITLTALQLLPGQSAVIGGDAPFRIKLLTRVSTGSFRIRLYDSTQQYFSQGTVGGGNATMDRVPDVCMFGDGALPFLMVPHPMIPAGGFIGFDIEDTSNATNTVEICFIGAKVYPTPPTPASSSSSSGS